MCVAREDIDRCGREWWMDGKEGRGSMLMTERRTMQTVEVRPPARTVQTRVAGRALRSEIQTFMARGCVQYRGLSLGIREV